MSGRLVIMTMILLTLIVGCNSSNEIDSDELAKYDVSQTNDETIKNDFLFRLVSEKEEYNQGEEVKVYGEIEYIGDQEEVTINHSSSAVLFKIEEKVRGYVIPEYIQEIGVETTLDKNKAYRTKYEKTGGHYTDLDSEDYVNFLQDFWDRDDFPAGYYVVKGVADFSFESERYEIEAEIDFKVLNE